MLDWHLCQICYPLEINLLLLLSLFVRKMCDDFAMHMMSSII